MARANLEPTLQPYSCRVFSPSPLVSSHKLTEGLIHPDRAVAFQDTIPLRNRMSVVRCPPVLGVIVYLTYFNLTVIQLFSYDRRFATQHLAPCSAKGLPWSYRNLVGMVDSDDFSFSARVRSLSTFIPSSPYR